MKKKKYPSITFRPLPAVEKELNRARRARLNVSQILNDLLVSGLPKELRRRKEILDRALKANPN